MALPTPKIALRNSYGGYFLDMWKYLVSLVAALNVATPPTYRAVITSIAAFTVASTTGVLTANASGALGTQDGITGLAVGDRVFLPAFVPLGGGGAVGQVNSGPYLIAQLGGASTPFILVRPPEYAQGSTITECVTFKIGSEGNFWAGNEWRAFPGVGATVGNSAPNFYPRTFSELITLAGGTATVSNFWIRNVNQVAGTNTAAAAAFNFAVTAGAGTGSIVATGTGTNTIAAFAVNF